MKGRQILDVSGFTLFNYEKVRTSRLTNKDTYMKYFLLDSDARIYIFTHTNRYIKGVIKMKDR